MPITLELFQFQQIIKNKIYSNKVALFSHKKNKRDRFTVPRGMGGLASKEGLTLFDAIGDFSPCYIYYFLPIIKKYTHIYKYFYNFFII